MYLALLYKLCVYIAVYIYNMTYAVLVVIYVDVFVYFLFWSLQLACGCKYAAKSFHRLSCRRQGPFVDQKKSKKPTLEKKYEIMIK